MGTALGIGLAAFGTAGSVRAQQVVTALAEAATPRAFSPDDLLFMEVTAEGYQLAETMNVYSSRSGVFIPLGEFSRVLGFAVGVFPAQARAEGWAGSRDRELTVDLRRGEARVGGTSFALADGQAAIYDDDLYVRLDLVELLLPVRLRADVSSQTLSVAPTEPLPFQQRLAREQRAAGLHRVTDPSRVLIARARYELFTPPAADLNFGGEVTRDGSDQTRRYDLRLAGDLLYSGFQGFVGSDQRGQANDVRVLFERKDPDGRALGPLGATRAGAGDVFTPSLAMGAGSLGGRGVYYTSAPLDALDLATPLDLRGELPLGEDVELYVNEVLRATQASADRGRYEFLDVPLTLGLNTIRLVFYGRQGQIREEVRRVNFGTGQVAAGKLVFRLGAVEQDMPLVRIRDRLDDDSGGAVRLAAAFDYGLSSELTLSGGLARYTPAGRQTRSVGLIGLRASLGALAAQFDIASDSEGGAGASVGFAARPFGISLVGSHSEYGNGFIDETQQSGFGGALLTRSSDFRLDAQLPLTQGYLLPVSFNVRRLEREDVTDLLTAEIRTSAPVGRYFLSGSLAYENGKLGPIRSERLVGSIDATTLVAARAQVRGGITYDLTEGAKGGAAYADLDYQISERSAFRMGFVRSLGEQSSTTFQASGDYRAPRFDVSLTASYETDRNDWRVGLQFGFGLSFDPFERRYRMVRPGAAVGGSVALSAFVDRNGDGVRQPDEAPVPDVVLETPAGAAVTGIDGHVLGAGLGDAGYTRMRVNLEGVNDPFLVGDDVIETVPRPGRVAVVNYPLQVTSEIELTARLRRGDTDRPLAAVELRLVPLAGGETIVARTDHAGVAFIEGVRPGRYRVTLDPEQAEGLGMTLESTPELVVPESGGFIRGGDVFVQIPAMETGA